MKDGFHPSLERVEFIDFFNFNMDIRQGLYRSPREDSCENPS